MAQRVDLIIMPPYFVRSHFLFLTILELPDLLSIFQPFETIVWNTWNIEACQMHRHFYSNLSDREAPGASIPLSRYAFFGLEALLRGSSIPQEYEPVARVCQNWPTGCLQARSLGFEREGLPGPGTGSDWNQSVSSGLSGIAVSTEMVVSEIVSSLPPSQRSIQLRGSSFSETIVSSVNVSCMIL